MIRRLFFALLAWVGITDGLYMVPNAHADVKVPAIFGDHMVLQRDAELKFWGWAEPGESVEIQIGASKSSTPADGEGKWRLELPAMVASKSPTDTDRCRCIMELSSKLFSPSTNGKRDLGPMLGSATAAAKTATGPSPARPAAIPTSDSACM